MKLKLLPAALLCFTAGAVHAQSLLKGEVRERGNNSKITNVFVRDINNNQMVLADNNGNFAIRTTTGHTLIINSPGYVSDTLYVIDMTPKKINMTVMTIALKQVNINSTRNGFDPHQEYPEIYQKSKVYVLSPSSWFGKEAHDARRLKRYFAMEQEDRKVDEVFNMVYVGSLVPLKGKDLEDFMTLYRPSYDFVKSNNRVSMAVYVNDCYKKFEALPPEKRHLERLSTDTI
jgi:hypothetical protein